MVNLSHQTAREPSVFLHQPTANTATPQQFVLDLSGLDPDTQWWIIVISTVIISLIVFILFTRKKDSEEIVIKGSDLRARESMKTLHRGPHIPALDSAHDFPPQEVRILPFGERYYRDRLLEGRGDETPKGSLGGTTIIGDRTFQRAIREEAISIRSFKASEQSFLDKQLNMSGRNSFLIEPKQKSLNRSLKSYNYSTMVEDDEDEIKNFLDNIDLSFETDFQPAARKHDPKLIKKAKVEC